MELTPEQRRRISKAAEDERASVEEARRRLIEEYGRPLIDEAVAEVQAALDIRTPRGDWSCLTRENSYDVDPKTSYDADDIIAWASISGIHIYKNYGGPVLIGSPRGSEGVALTPANFGRALQRREANIEASRQRDMH